VGESSRDRKSTSIKMAQGLLADVEESRLGPGDFTSEGLVFHMRKRKAGNSRNKLILPIQEFGTLLASTGSYNSGLGAILCALYDGENYSRVRSGKKPVHIEKPRLSLIGGCAYGMLEAYADPREWTTGLFARFLFVTPRVARERQVIQPEPSATAKDDALKALVDLNRYLKETRAPMKTLPEAEEVIRDFSSRLPELDDPAAIAQRERLINATWKLSMLFQIDEAPDQHIGRNAALWACKLAAESWEAFLKIRQLTDIDPLGKAQQRVLRMVATAGPGGISRREVHQGVGGRTQNVNPAIELLIKNERIYVRNEPGKGTAGRPKQMLVLGDSA
jgi:hypothetical protein